MASVSTPAANGAPARKRRRMSPLRMALWGLLGLALIVVPTLLQANPTMVFLVRILVIVGIWILLALGLNIVVGYAGLLDLGYVAFYGMGGYVGMILGTATSDVLGGATYWVMLAPAAVAAALTGVLLGFPVLKLRGDYLAMVTLGFGEIVRIMLNNNILGLTNGGAGLPKGRDHVVAPWPSTWLADNLRFESAWGWFTFGPNLFWFFVVVGLIIAAITTIRRLDNSRLGRAWVAMRENEVAAASCGVNIRTQKLWAFSIGAMSGGIAGVTFAYVQQFISPESFTFMESVFVVCIIVLGGMGSIPGVIVGALVIRGIPDLIQGLIVAGVIKVSGDVASTITGYRFLIFGLLMVVMVIVRPQGMIPSKRRAFELTTEDETEIENRSTFLYDIEHGRVKADGRH